MVIAGIFLLLINSSWKATADSALYLELGESLARGTGYAFNGEPHTYVPPGYPVMVWAAVRLFGEGFLAYRVLMALMGLVTAGLGYLVINRLCGRDTAFVVGGLFALNHTLVYNSTFTTSDVPFALLSLLAVYVIVCAARTPYQLSWIVLAGLVAGLPALVRINGWGIPPAGAVFLLCEPRDEKGVRRAIGAFLFVAVSLIPGILWQFHKSFFPQSFSEGSYFDAVSGRGLGLQATIVLNSLWEYAHEMTVALTAVSLRTGVLESIVPLLVLIGLATALARGERFLVPLTVIQLSGLLLSPAGSRYLILLIPGLYLFLALGLIRVLGRVSSAMGSRFPRWCTARLVVVGFFGLIAVLNVAQDVATVVQSRTALEQHGPESARDLPFFEAARWLRAQDSDSVVLTMHPRVIRYLTRMPTVELVRSGVPETQVWVDAGSEIQKLVRGHEPSYLFSDGKNERLFNEVIHAIRGMGLRLEEIPGATSSRRFRLWKIHPMN